MQAIRGAASGSRTHTHKAQEPKSCTSANSVTAANKRFNVSQVRTPQLVYTAPPKG